MINQQPTRSGSGWIGCCAIRAILGRRFETITPLEGAPVAATPRVLGSHTIPLYSVLKTSVLVPPHSLPASPRSHRTQSHRKQDAPGCVALGIPVVDERLRSLPYICDAHRAWCRTRAPAGTLACTSPAIEGDVPRAHAFAQGASLSTANYARICVENASEFINQWRLREPGQAVAPVLSIDLTRVLGQGFGQARWTWDAWDRRIEPRRSLWHGGNVGTAKPHVTTGGRSPPLAAVPFIYSY